MNSGIFFALCRITLALENELQSTKLFLIMPERDSQAKQSNSSSEVSVIQKGSQSQSDSERNFYSTEAEKWMEMGKSGAVSLSVDSFGVMKDPVTKKEETVWLYTWKNSLSRVAVKVRAMCY